jgi:restriction endonuclease Mrr
MYTLLCLICGLLSFVLVFDSIGKKDGTRFLVAVGSGLGARVFGGLSEIEERKLKERHAQQKERERRLYLERLEADRPRFEAEAKRREEGTRRRRAELERQLEEAAVEMQRQRDEAEENAAKDAWVRFHQSKSMQEIETMSGMEFEKWLKLLFTKMGYKVSLTPINDQGGDLVCISDCGTRMVVQSKRSKYTVGNRAVQEILGAMLFYDCQKGCIVTNNKFTVAARELAEKDSRIALCDGKWLQEQILSLFPPEIPNFNWDDYISIVKEKQSGDK